MKGAMLTFEGWNPDERTLRLTEGWSFYWQELLLPGQKPAKEPLELQKELCWQKLTNPVTQQHFPSFGYGTYILRMRGFPGSNQGLEFFIRSAATAYELYIYPEERPEDAVKIGDGFVGTS